MNDQLLKFLLPQATVRGEVLQLGAAWRQMTAHHDYPPPVRALLGQATAAAALLAAGLKFKGALTLQIHGDGPLRLLVVECQSDLRLRATAKLRGDAVVAADATLTQLVNAQGQGRCAITLDMQDRLPGQQPYQGVVPLAGDSIASAIEAYMRQSEQLDTRLWLAADADVAAGLLLQRLPGDGGRRVEAQDEDAWPRVQMLAGTLSAGELLTVPAPALVQRLFWQERLEPVPAAAPRFECRCSRERVGRMLRTLGRTEIDSVLAESGQVEVTCDFCNARQRFDAVDVGQLFATGATDDAAPERPH